MSRIITHDSPIQPYIWVETIGEFSDDEPNRSFYTPVVRAFDLDNLTMTRVAMYGGEVSKELEDKITSLYIRNPEQDVTFEGETGMCSRPPRVGEPGYDEMPTVAVPVLGFYLHPKTPDDLKALYPDLVIKEYWEKPREPRDLSPIVRAIEGQPCDGSTAN